MKKLLIATDSLGLPRNFSENVPVNSTWPYLLKKYYTTFDIEFLKCRGRIIQHIYDDAYHYEKFEPDFVIIQSGIVDCAPRAFNRYELEIIKLLPFKIPKPFIKTLRKYRHIVYTNPTVYQDYVEKFTSLFINSEIYFIETMPALSNYEKIVPGINKSIQRYNSILRENKRVKLIENKDFNDEDMLSDLHHLSIKGNEKLFKKIVNKLDEYLINK